MWDYKQKNQERFLFHFRNDTFSEVNWSKFTVELFKNSPWWAGKFFWNKHYHKIKLGMTGLIAVRSSRKAFWRAAFVNWANKYLQRPAMHPLRRSRILTLQNQYHTIPTACLPARRMHFIHLWWHAVQIADPSVWGTLLFLRPPGRFIFRRKIAAIHKASLYGTVGSSKKAAPSPYQKDAILFHNMEISITPFSKNQIKINFLLWTDLLEFHLILFCSSIYQYACHIFLLKTLALVSIIIEKEWKTLGDGFFAFVILLFFSKKKDLSRTKSVPYNSGLF